MTIQKKANFSPGFCFLYIRPYFPQYILIGMWLLLPITVHKSLNPRQTFAFYTIGDRECGLLVYMKKKFLQFATVLDFRLSA